MKKSDDTTPIRRSKKPLSVWIWVALTIGLLGVIGSAIFVIWTPAKSTPFHGNSRSIPIVSRGQPSPFLARNPPPKGFDAKDLEITYMWLRTEYTAVEKSRSNEAAHVTTRRDLRNKFDSLEGQQVSWKFEIQQISNGNKGKMIVYAFFYRPQLLLTWEPPILPNVRNSGVALCATNFDTFNGAKQVNSPKGFEAGIEVPAEGAVLEAIQGDQVILNAKIVNVVDCSLVGQSLSSYSACFVITDPKLIFVKK